MYELTTSEQIKVLCLRSGISVSELARRLNQTPQNFNAKLKRGSVSPEEIEQICSILDVSHAQYFIMKDGEIIK